MIKRTYRTSCYFCGAKADTMEHAPPRQMFKGFECDSITVPSCQAHNTSKCGADQAIVSALLIPLDNGRDRYPYEVEVLKAIELARPSFERAKRKAISSPLVKNSPIIQALMPKVSFLAPSVDMKGWVTQLTAALLWDAVKKHDPRVCWPKVISWSAEWMGANVPASFEPEQAARMLMDNNLLKAQFQSLAWLPGWTAHPRPYPTSIFHFAVYLGSTHEVGFRLTFYGRYTWYVLLKIPAGFHKKIQRRITEGTQPGVVADGSDLSRSVRGTARAISARG